MKSNNLNNNKVSFKESFQTPPSLYRGAPFWSWNGDLKKEEILRQIDIFEEMGIGGYHIHPRTGMTTEYLGDEYMDLVKACRDHGKEKGMLTWLYDEDRWPSGFAGGIVTKNKEYRLHYLLITTTPYGIGPITIEEDSVASGTRSEKGHLLKTIAVCLKNKFLHSYRTLEEGQAPNREETIWYVYLETATDSPWYNNQAYVDTLNPQAIEKFIEVTHEKYKESVGDSFGAEIPAIFTDEPQFTRKTFLNFAHDTHDITLPWTPDLEKSFFKQHKQSILDLLPEIIWDLPENKVSTWRYQYHEWVAERFACSFADQIGQWCEQNNIALTGHLMEEPTLSSQTNALGDAMRSYRSFQIPGIDMLCDKIELSTAKQAQSAARQFGRPGILSELYGVTGWHFDFKGHKRQGDWQAALGVLFRVHHLTWYSMKGEAKRDYPASIGYQSPWYKEYKVIEDHFARLGATLSRGKAVCKVAVLHPIESYWVCAGPYDTSSAERKENEHRFSNLIKWLLFGGIDFDFVSESLLPSQTQNIDTSNFNVGEMNYQVVLVPSMKTIRSSSLDRLEEFARNGGRILFAGMIPSHVDAKESKRAIELAAKCENISYGESALLGALEKHRDVEFRSLNGRLTRSLLYQMREENNERYLFVCNTNADMNQNKAESFTLSLKGEWKINALDTSKGTSKPIASTYNNNSTHTKVHLEAVEHILLHLTPGQETNGDSLDKKVLQEVSRLSSPVSITLDEPNVNLFDKAEYSINGGHWQTEQPLLQIENVLRQELDMMPKSGKTVAQPWTDTSPVKKLADISLRFNFKSDIACQNTQLALENLNESTITFDGVKVDKTPQGFYTDKSIQTINLPNFDKGEHCIEIKLIFTKETSIEWIYLLGNFGVTIEGTRGKLTKAVQELSFGDWTTQGLPFYGGNLTYHCHIPTEDGSHIQIPQFKGSLIKVKSLDKEGTIYHPPYCKKLAMKTGDKLDITVYGNRANCFGPVHLSDPSITWLGPNSYRSSDHCYSPEYNLKPLGIMSAPIVLTDKI